MTARTSNGLKPVVAIDLDGTLGPYHEHFRWFLELYTGKKHPPSKIVYNETFKWDGSEPFFKWLGVSKATYRQAKLAYRQGGMKRCMPAYYYAGQLTRDVRAAGAEVWICTTRPWLRLDNIDPDTRHWLRRNRIAYDGVLFGEQKYRDLARIVGKEAVVAVLDDLPEQIFNANRLGLFPLCIDQPYNAPIGEPPVNRLAGGFRVYDLEEAAAELCGMIEDWKATHGNV